jgi:hypothetical protein
MDCIIRDSRNGCQIQELPSSINQKGLWIIGLAKLSVGGVRQIFDILVKNLDNLLQLLHSINVWCGNEQPDRS